MNPDFLFFKANLPTFLKDVSLEPLAPSCSFLVLVNVLHGYLGIFHFCAINGQPSRCLPIFFSFFCHTVVISIAVCRSEVVDVNQFEWQIWQCLFSWPHTDGEEYYTLIDEFMAAVKLRWPRALIQFEDFQSKHAIATLKRYRKEYLMFNDDIQVTMWGNYVNLLYYDYRNS